MNHSNANAQRDQEALSTARNGTTWTNYPAIIGGFVAMGIPETEILPRENVFTFSAWRALGRMVRKGQHGVRVITMRSAVKIDDHGKEHPYRFPWHSTVFHVSQTEPR